MVRLFLDIETLPCEESKRDVVVEILKKKASNAQKDHEQLFLETSFDGTFGRVCCIGFIKETGNQVTHGVCKGDEKALLEEFWKIAADVHIFIGHNVMEFDLPFIYQRSMIQGVKPSRLLSFAKYRNNPIYDTMKEWVQWGYIAAPKLDTLAKVLNLPTSKDEMDGSQVYTYFQDGKLDDICRYCLKDVVLTRQVFYKMNFEEPSDIPGIEEYLQVKHEAEQHDEPILTASITGQTTLLPDTEEIPF